MPLGSAGKKVLRKMQERYGSDKGKRVFYAKEKHTGSERFKRAMTAR